MMFESWEKVARRWASWGDAACRVSIRKNVHYQENRTYPQYGEEEAAIRVAHEGLTGWSYQGS